MTDSKKIPWPLLLAFILSLIPYFFFLGSAGLFEPEETRHAEMAREMLSSGDWLVPRMNGLPYLEKPPLTTWLVAGSFALFGENELTARLLPLLSALLILLYTIRIGAKLGGIRLGLIAASLLASTPLFFGMGRILSTDTLFAAATVAGFYYLLEARENPKTSHLFLLGLSTAAATLTKGPIGFLLILLGAISFAWVERSARMLRIFFHPISLVSFFILCAPWFVYICLRYPEFGEFYFLHHHLVRFLGLEPEIKDLHPEPIYYYLPVFLGGFFPWVIYLLTAARNAWKRFDRSDFALLHRALWMNAWLITAFFLFSSGKRTPYLLPAWPFFAIGIAAYLAQTIEGNARDRKKLAKPWLFLLLLPLGFFLIRFLDLDFGNDFQVVITLLGQFPLWLSAWIAIGILGIGILLKKSRFTEALCLSQFWILGIFCSSVLAFPRANSFFSLKEIAQRAAERAGQDTPIYIFPRYRPGLPYYSKRAVLVGGVEDELEFGLRVEPQHSELVLDRESFFEWAAKPNSHFVLVVRRAHAQKWPVEFRKRFELLEYLEPWLILRK